MKDLLSTYLKTETPLPKIIVVYGPTACGKTAISLEIAWYVRDLGYDPHIISADSRQIYRGLDIGTGKIRKEEMQGISHHMLDVIDPSEKYSMVDFRRDVDVLSFWQKEKIMPIVCGGTGLYIDAILYDMEYPDNPPDWDYRQELENIRAEKWNEYLWQMLHDVDPLYADELIPENYRYVMRGLEVIRDTWRSKRESHNTKKLRFSPLFLTPYTDSSDHRKYLYETINHRVESMFKNWLIEETTYNLQKFTSHCPGLDTIGYREVVEYIEWLHTLDETIALVAQHSRNYAKRQITWNKRYVWI